jgi:Anti-sigma factor NepR
MSKLKGGPSGRAAEVKSTVVDPVTAALRRMHDNIAAEPIPDDFLELLEKIDAKMIASKK